MRTITAGEKIALSGMACSHCAAVVTVKAGPVEVAADEISKMRLRSAMTKSIMPSWKRSTISGRVKLASGPRSKGGPRREGGTYRHK